MNSIEGRSELELRNTELDNKIIDLSSRISTLKNTIDDLEKKVRAESKAPQSKGWATATAVTKALLPAFILSYFASFSTTSQLENLHSQFLNLLKEKHDSYHARSGVAVADFVDGKIDAEIRVAARDIAKSRGEIIYKETHIAEASEDKFKKTSREALKLEHLSTISNALSDLVRKDYSDNQKIAKVSQYLEKNGIGVTISSTADIDELIKSVDAERKNLQDTIEGEASANAKQRAYYGSQRQGL